MANIKSKAITRKQKVDLSWIDQLHPDHDWETMEPRIKKLQVKRDFRFYDRYVLGHRGKSVIRIYQLAGAAPMIYLQKEKIQASIKEWMILDGSYTEAEIIAWSAPRYEWPEERITPEEEVILWEWREEYDIKDRTDWSQGIRLTADDKKKLDKYKQVSVLQPRQTGKSEVVVRVNGYVMTNVNGFKSAVFAPTEKQAKNFIFKRTREYIELNDFYKGRFAKMNSLDLAFNTKDHPTKKANGSTFAAVSASPGANIEGDSLDWAIIDESQDVTDYKVKKSIKYMLAAKLGAMIKIGTVNTVKGHFWESTTKKGERFWHQVIIYPDICAASNEWWRDFITNVIEEDGRWSDTVRMSVFLEWMLSIGMFITEEQWDSLMDPELDWVTYDKKGLQFATIDVAKSRDETVVKVAKVNQKITVAGRHPFTILNIMTLPGIDYDTQFEQIKRWLDSNYNVAAIGIDDTGERGGLGARFTNTQYRTELFTYTRPGKSEWYTNLQTMINAHYAAFKEGNWAEKLIRIPGTEQAQKEKIHRDFGEQMLSLTREYKDKYMVVKHPDIEGAKDDYPDTFMMMAWMASRVHISVDDLIDSIESGAETEMDKMDWQDDQYHSKHQRNARSNKRKGSKDDEELKEIENGVSDLDSLW